MDILFDIQIDKRCNFCGEIKPWIYYARTSQGRRKGKDEHGRIWKGARCPDCVSVYRDQNKHRIADTAKAWYEANKEHCLSVKKQWRDDNKEHIADYNKIQYAKHKDGYYKERDLRPERIAAKRNTSAIRNLQIENTDDRSINAESLYELRYDIQENRCVYCFVNLDDVNVELDHVEPLSRGGEHRFYNVLYACEPCNREKRARLPSEWIKV